MIAVSVVLHSPNANAAQTTTASHPSACPRHITRKATTRPTTRIAIVESSTASGIRRASGSTDGARRCLAMPWASTKSTHRSASSAAETAV